MPILYGENGPKWKQILSRKSRIVPKPERPKIVHLNSVGDSAESPFETNDLPLGTPTQHFAKLPFDIILEILLHLELKDVLAVARVCDYELRRRVD